MLTVITQANITEVVADINSCYAGKVVTTTTQIWTENQAFPPSTKIGMLEGATINSYKRNKYDPPIEPTCFTFYIKGDGVYQSAIQWKYESDEKGFKLSGSSAGGSKIEWKMEVRNECDTNRV